MRLVNDSQIDLFDFKCIFASIFKNIFAHMDI